MDEIPLNNGYRRSQRIQTLFGKALTGKYTWRELILIAEAMGVSKSTAKSYVDAVENRLHKQGYLKKNG